jgi:hypothetical protein
VRYHSAAMRTRFHISRRRRLLLAVTVLFCLLFQQVVMAAYVCTLPVTSAMGVGRMADCAEMGMGAKTHAGDPTDPRCTEHCANHVPTTANTQAPTVPPLLLPSELAAVTHAWLQSPAQHAHLPNPEFYPPDPPPTLRFCTLLI